MPSVLFLLLCCVSPCRVSFMLSVFLLLCWVLCINCFIECRYAECRFGWVLCFYGYTECHYAEWFFFLLHFYCYAEWHCAFMLVVLYSGKSIFKFISCFPWLKNSNKFTRIWTKFQQAKHYFFKGIYVNRRKKVQGTAQLSVHPFRRESIFFVNTTQFDILLARDFLASNGSVQGPVL